MWTPRGSPSEPPRCIAEEDVLDVVNLRSALRDFSRQDASPRSCHEQLINIFSGVSPRALSLLKQLDDESIVALLMLVSAKPAVLAPRATRQIIAEVFRVICNWNEEVLSDTLRKHPRVLHFSLVGCPEIQSVPEEVHAAAVRAFSSLDTDALRFHCPALISLLGHENDELFELAIQASKKVAPDTLTQYIDGLLDLLVHTSRDAARQAISGLLEQVPNCDLHRRAERILELIGDSNLDVCTAVARIVARIPELLNFRDRMLNLPLHMAARRGSVDICKRLVDAGARIHEKNCFGESPEDVARMSGHFGVCVFLSASRAQPNVLSEYTRDSSIDVNGFDFVCSDRSDVPSVPLLLSEHTEEYSTAIYGCSTLCSERSDLARTPRMRACHDIPGLHSFYFNYNKGIAQNAYSSESVPRHNTTLPQKPLVTHVPKRRVPRQFTIATI